MKRNRIRKLVSSTRISGSGELSNSNKKIKEITKTSNKSEIPLGCGTKRYKALQALEALIPC